MNLNELKFEHKHREVIFTIETQKYINTQITKYIINFSLAHNTKLCRALAATTSANLQRKACALRLTQLLTQFLLVLSIN
jgi:hypothetical protein